MKWPDALRPVAKAAAALLLAVAVLVSAYAATAWSGLGIGPAAVTGFWLAMCAASFAASVGAAFVCFGEARTWAQSTVKWRTVALHVGAFVACLAYFGAVIVAVVAWRWWPR